MGKSRLNSTVDVLNDSGFYGKSNAQKIKNRGWYPPFVFTVEILKGKSF